MWWNAKGGCCQPNCEDCATEWNGGMNLNFMGAVDLKMREQDIMEDTQLFYELVWKKEEVEASVFFRDGDKAMRLDAGVALNKFSSPYEYDWTAEDGYMFVSEIVKIAEDSRAKGEFGV